MSNIHIKQPQIKRNIAYRCLTHVTTTHTPVKTPFFKAYAKYLYIFFVMLHTFQFLKGRTAH